MNVSKDPNFLYIGPQCKSTGAPLDSYFQFLDLSLLQYTVLILYSITFVTAYNYVLSHQKQDILLRI